MFEQEPIGVENPFARIFNIYYGIIEYLIDLQAFAKKCGWHQAILGALQQFAKYGFWFCFVGFTPDWNSPHRDWYPYLTRPDGTRRRCAPWHILTPLLVFGIVIVFTF